MSSFLLVSLCIQSLPLYFISRLSFSPSLLFVDCAHHVSHILFFPNISLPCLALPYFTSPIINLHLPFLSFRCMGSLSIPCFSLLFLSLAYLSSPFTLSRCFLVPCHLLANLSVPYLSFPFLRLGLH